MTQIFTVSSAMLTDGLVAMGPRLALLTALAKLANPFLMRSLLPLSSLTISSGPRLLSRLTELTIDTINTTTLPDVAYQVRQALIAYLNPTKDVDRVQVSVSTTFLPDALMVTVVRSTLYIRSMHDITVVVDRRKGHLLHGDIKDSLLLNE